MSHFASIRSATTPYDVPKSPKDGLLAPQDAPKTHPKRPQDGSKTPPRRTTTPSGWSQLRPAAPKAAKKPSKPRFWTLWTSILDPPDLDFGPSIRRFSILQTLAQEPPNSRPRCAKTRPNAALELSRKRPSSA